MWWNIKMHKRVQILFATKLLLTSVTYCLWATKLCLLFFLIDSGSRYWGECRFWNKKKTFSKGLFKVIVLYLLNKMRSFIKRRTSDISSDNEWQRLTQQVAMVQRLTTSENEWKQLTTSGTRSAKTSDNEWQQIIKNTKSGHFS